MMQAYFEQFKDVFFRREEQEKQLIPDKLVKFIPLSENATSNEKRFIALQEEKLWFSQVDSLNDPYEYRCMIVDEKRLSEHGYPQEIISAFTSLLNNGRQNIVLVSLSGNKYDSLPMWAYYSNNYKGFCVEYEVLSKEHIHMVSYEPERVPLATILAEFYCESSKMIRSGKEQDENVDFFCRVLEKQFFMKHDSWAHENEFRIIAPSDDGKGKLIPISDVGLRTSRIIAGINCSQENVERLQAISEEIACGKCFQARISDSKYTFLEETK